MFYYFGGGRGGCCFGRGCCAGIDPEEIPPMKNFTSVEDGTWCHEKLHFGVGRRLAPCKTTLLCRRVVLPLKLECYRCGGCRSLCSSKKSQRTTRKTSCCTCNSS